MVLPVVLRDKVRLNFVLGFMLMEYGAPGAAGWEDAMELLIRAGRDDHLVVADLCAPATTGLRLAPRVPFHAIVTDAPVAAARPQLREKVEAAAVPFLIDPMTFLLQDDQPPEQAWARLPFAVPEKLLPRDLADGGYQDELIERVLTFQRQQGATVLIPPYLYLAKRSDGSLPVQLDLLRRTARYLERESIDLPVAPIFAASLHQFGPRATWADGLDQFLARMGEMNVRFVGLSLSWSGQGNDSYDTLATLLTATRHTARIARTVSWRQGLYGAATVAAGADGYETGPGHGERGMYPAMMRSRRPTPTHDVADDESSPRGNAFVYLPALGRSIRRSDARMLFDDWPSRATLLCPDDTCCPSGATSMVERWRQHAIRSRASQLEALTRMPNHPSWRLNQIAREAERAATVARNANEVLQRSGSSVTIPEQSYRHLAEVADAVRAEANSDVA